MTKGKLTIIRTCAKMWHPFDRLTRRREDGFDVWFFEYPETSRPWHFTHYGAGDWPSWYHTDGVRRCTSAAPVRIFTAGDTTFQLEVIEP